jgi:hypothetical protein
MGGSKPQIKMDRRRIYRCVLNKRDDKDFAMVSNDFRIKGN